MTHYGEQLIGHLLYYRQAIIESKKIDYPKKLMLLIEKLLDRKSAINKKRGSRKVSSEFYVEEKRFLDTLLERPFVFFNRVLIRNINYETFSSTKSKKFSDCCVSFIFGQSIKHGFIRAIVMDDVEN